MRKVTTEIRVDVGTSIQIMMYCIYCAGPMSMPTSSNGLSIMITQITTDATCMLLRFDYKMTVEKPFPNFSSNPNFLPLFAIGMKQATASLRGHYIPNPYWAGLFAKLRHTKGVTTVHPLGGCGMGETGQEGVVNHEGQVSKMEVE